MKFTEINLEESGWESALLALLQKKIDGSFALIRKADRAGVSCFKAVRKDRILEMIFVESAQRFNHIWLSVKGVKTFYGNDQPVSLKEMDAVGACALKQFTADSVVDENIFSKVIMPEGDDWPASISIKMDAVPA
jgi:hypothetical protein